MQQKATARYIKVTPRKLRSVADLVRGLTVNEAEAQLLHESRRAAKPILKLLRSAAANAKNTKKASEGDVLFVESIRVDGGPMLKRSLPRARGMATPIQKHMSHLTLTLSISSKPGRERFKIAAPKKTKLPPAERPKTKKGKQHDEEKEKPRQERKQGFFKNMFRRKSI